MCRVRHRARHSTEFPGVHSARRADSDAAWPIRGGSRWASGPKGALRQPEVPHGESASLKKAAEATAREDGSTLNQFIVSAVAEKVSALKTAEYFTDRAARGEKVRALRFLRRKGGEVPRKGDERD